MTNPEMHLYAVGELYHPSRTSWPQAVQYLYRQGGHELLLFWPSPAPQEIEAVAEGKSEFSLLVPSRDLLFFLYRFGDMEWSDQPFSWWLVPSAERTLPNPEPTHQERALLQVRLVDAATGIIKVLRAVSLPPALTAALHEAIRTQAKTAFEARAYDKRIEAAYRQYPTAAQMVEAAWAFGKGGE